VVVLVVQLAAPSVVVAIVVGLMILRKLVVTVVMKAGVGLVVVGMILALLVVEKVVLGSCPEAPCKHGHKRL